MNDLNTHAHSDSLVISDDRESFELDMAEMHEDCPIPKCLPVPDETDDDSDAEVDDFEDDGQPDEYTEWQALDGGDDWNQGQFDY